ncbi:cAMP-dependent protein kinase catalytic subunit gamma-like [Galendromus occidentalis]|uniref:Serine/threonine-protein kinase greatwall n=1 Tax=Galendromus occidentalis TaxID=34638 RepID=A0AAJ6VYE5_9ACAR|nr:cAMP-dependent protein kinase catalytic subunit gamma-like [Galendromus occidentalis]
MGIIFSTAKDIFSGGSFRTLREAREVGRQRRSAIGRGLDPDLYRVHLIRGKRHFDVKYDLNSCPHEEIKGNYKIKGFLSRGAWGKVFKAKHNKEEGSYAIKVIPKITNISNEDKELRVKEKKLHFALVSDFVVALYSAYQDPVNLYLVMEYAKYGSLDRFITKPNSLSENTIKLIAAQLVLGLEFIHGCDVIYRDLKVQNVLVFSDGYVKIGDFGLSRRYGGRAHSLVGTPDNMAPEMADSENGYGLEVDFWALGILLYRLAYNMHPFRPDHGAFTEREILERARTCHLLFPGVEEDGELNPTEQFLAGLLRKIL